MESWAITDKGKVRKQNQDAFYASCEDGAALLLVCDGMGGANAGDVASAMAVKVFINEVKKGLKSELEEMELQNLLEDSLDTANSAVYEYSCVDPDCEGMGTTVVSAIVRNGNAIVLNVGDSRAYQISGGKIRQITRDHSVIEDMIQRGEITREQSRYHPNKNLITRALGTAPWIECDFFTTKLEEGDFLLLCSDGLSNIVTDEEMAEEVTAENALQLCCENLVGMAIGRGAPDNVTVVLYKQ